MKTPVSRARDMFRSLRLTLVLSMVVPLMVFSGVAIYVGLGAVERNLNDRLREDLELVARAVSGPLSQAMSDGDEIGALDLSLHSLSDAPVSVSSGEPVGNHKEARAQWEKVYLERLLRECGGNVSEAARRAGKYRSDLYSLLRKHAIEPQDYKA